MSSPSYSERTPGLSTASHSSNNDRGYHPDPATPDTDRYAYSEDGLEDQHFGGFDSLQHGHAVYDHASHGDLPRINDLENDIRTTTTERANAKRPGLVSNEIDVRSINEASLPAGSGPFPDRFYANQQAVTPPLSARVVCEGCSTITTIFAAPGQPAVVIPVPAFCQECTDIIDMQNADEAPRMTVPIPKQQYRLDQSVPPKLVFQCDIDGCTTTCKRPHDLTRHKLRKHGLSGVLFRCDTCGRKSNRDDKMKEHCRKQHQQRYGEERFTEVAE